MKKIIVFAAILLTSSYAAMAQHFALGIKGGVNYSTLKTSGDLTNEESMLGYQAGVFTRLGALGLYVQPELYLGSKGNEFTVESADGTGIESKGKVKFTTLDLPVLLGIKIGPSKSNFRLMAGPVVSFIVDQNTTFDDAYDQVTDFDNYKNQAIGAQAGAGVDLGSFTIDLRYEAGLSNVNESDKYDQKQNLFHLSLGFKIL